ncbi:MAG: hypothetical protein WA766_03535, partial [Candidatus Acidiferrales bacterium]
CKASFACFGGSGENPWGTVNFQQRWFQLADSKAGRPFHLWRAHPIIWRSVETALGAVAAWPTCGGCAQMLPMDEFADALRIAATNRHNSQNAARNRTKED